MITTGSLPIVTYPNPMLSRRSDEVMEIDDDIVSLIEAMKLSMQAAKGIGLAAPQVGRNLRIVTIGCVPGPALGLINPVIVEGHGRTSIVEGCLSFPDFECRPRGRRKQVHMRAYNVRGEPVELEADGLLSICLQHEIDHLNGITIIDRLSGVERSAAARRRGWQRSWL